jgi:hypothetical protein
MTFANVGGRCSCERCGVPLEVAPIPGSQAKLLKRSATPQGLCASCAVHDHLRHLYPANLTLARGGPQLLAHPHIQQMYLDLLRMAGTDVTAEEIDWNAIIANWELPFPTRLKSTATNPVTQEELDRERVEGEQRRSGNWKPPLSAQEQRAMDKAAMDHAARDVLDFVRRERHEDSPTDRSDGQ